MWKPEPWTPNSPRLTSLSPEGRCQTKSPRVPPGPLELLQAVGQDHDVRSSCPPPGACCSRRAGSDPGSGGGPGQGAIYQGCQGLSRARPRYPRGLRITAPRGRLLRAFGAGSNDLVSPAWEKAARPAIGSRSMRLPKSWALRWTLSGSAYLEAPSHTNATKKAACGYYWTPTRTRPVMYETPTSRDLLAMRSYPRCGTASSPWNASSNRSARPTASTAGCWPRPWSGSLRS
jgi:hypothetical protein